MLPVHRKSPCWGNPEEAQSIATRLGAKEVRASSWRGRCFDPTERPRIASKCQPNSGQPHSAGEAEILMSALQAGFFALFSLLVFPETEVRLTLFVYGYAAEQQCSSPGSALPASITMLPYFAQ